jgi:hypothetical protein
MMECTVLDFSKRHRLGERHAHIGCPAVGRDIWTGDIVPDISPNSMADNRTPNTPHSDKDRVARSGTGPANQRIYTDGGSKARIGQTAGIVVYWQRAAIFEQRIEERQLDDTSCRI